jgi:ribosomal protein S18 acetylase RimI-like enzyme
MDWRHDDYTLTDDRDRADVAAIHALLATAYWAGDRSHDAVARSVANSLCFSLFHEGAQVGVARVLTDVGASSYVCDVVIASGHRRRGIGRWLMECLLGHPAVRDTRVILITRDAQAFYRGLGFATHPYECMIRREPSGEA